MSESLEYLIERHIIPISRENEWQGFRDELMWNLDCNDVLACNLEGLMKVFNLYTRGYLKTITFDDVVDLLSKASDLKMSIKDITYCYGMSKMTVSNENDEKESDKYHKLQPVEYMELIGRVASIIFKGSELDELPLNEKMEYVLDDLFTAVKGLKRKPVIIQEEFEETASDSDY